MLYGTFDHPNLIRYNELEKNLKEYFKTGKTKQPKYSFVEKRTTHYETIEGEADYVIVEGIYTIKSLSRHFDATNIFVHSEKEELIFRRIVRDQQRVAEPTYMIVQAIGKAFPMRNIYGAPQEKHADIIIDNDYEILGKVGRQCIYSPLKNQHNENRKKSDLGRLIEKRNITDFYYQDNDPENGDIIISEVYKE